MHQSMEITRVRELNLGLACPYLPPSAALEELSRVYFEKTELGCVEVVRRIADLPARLRRLLILVDGRRSVAELAQFAGVEKPSGGDG